jgi:membrane-bound lytic murein transglycosylase D
VGAADTLASVAHQFRVSESELAEVNQLRSTDSLQGVEALVIPQALVTAASTRTVLYTARRGDTLVTIADRFGVSLTQLRNWNHMSGARVAPGQRLHVTEPGGAPHAAPAHRRESAAAEKAPQAATGKGTAGKGSTGKSAAQKGTAASPKKTAAAASGSKPAQKTHAASSASKTAKATGSGAPGAKKKQTNKPSTHAKSSSQ